ncbi:MAG: Phenylalanine 4-hydroxylase [Gammaproteobacteria bacterium]|jgi:phenylalanine-4-hydroxylase|nr:Phenylalanine 4-hydroxylase [Gammaproteobacteria bacterium]
MTKYTAKPTDAQGFVHYTPAENHTWQTLFNRQMTIMKEYACQAHIDGVDKLYLKANAIPQIPDISKHLMAATSWQAQAVEALISDQDFFTLLSQRIFPVATFIRVPEEVDYLPEPDIFHEVFGHCPMLMHTTIADFIEAYGRYALQAPADQLKRLSRLFWFTIEFGLIQTPKGLRAYGGGILSSYKETIYSIDDTFPQRKPFNLLEVLCTDFRIDKMQGIYFVLHSFEQLFELLQGNTLQRALEQACALSDLPMRYKE